MDVFYEDTYRVDSRNVDLFGHCRPSAVLGLLQEAATQAARAIHVSREELMERYHAFWMLSRIRYELKRPFLWDEPVTIKTWHRGGKAAMMYREFDLFVEGEAVGRALSTWVMADLETHKLFHLSKVAEFEGTTGGSLCRSDILRKLKMPEGLSLTETRRMHYSDTDINGHVNNIKYADFVCDALRLEKLGAGKFVSALQICYLAECLAGEELGLYIGQERENWYATGKGSEGKMRFDAILTLDNLPAGD